MRETSASREQITDAYYPSSKKEGLAHEALPARGVVFSAYSAYRRNSRIKQTERCREYREPRLT